MKTFAIQTGIREFTDVREWADAYEIGGRDLILTNEYIYEPLISALGLPCHLLFQEKYGAGEPTDEMVDAIIGDLEQKDFDRIFAIGGGTIIDIAKVLAVAAPGDRLDDLYDRAPALDKTRGLVIVPTTCGTGSEVTNISVISRVRKGVKQGLVSPAMYADEAALVPELLMSLPYSVFATSSIDAMIHAAEALLSPNACPASELFSERALEIILTGWRQSAEEGGEDAWKKRGAEFLRASNFAGIAFGYAGVGAVHALSYPVGSVHHVPHGQSNQLLFEAVMRKYQEKKPIGKINQLEELIADILDVEPVFAMGELYKLMDVVYSKGSLRNHGVTPEELPVFAQNVLETQQRLLANNYVELSQEEILDIYNKAF